MVRCGANPAGLGRPLQQRHPQRHQSSEDLLNWLYLGSVLADTNGLIQFDDTNAPACPSRFYYTSPQ
jgi:hypothetical protein